MTYLLDTHVLLWAIGDASKLSRRAAALIVDPANDCAVSVASLWEIAIKVQRDKLDIPTQAEYFEYQFSRLGIRRVVGIGPDHVYSLMKLPMIHGDPFDRMLAAQCLAERMPLVTVDRIFKKYPIEVVW